MAGRRLTFNTPETPQLGRGLGDRNTSTCPAVDNRVFTAIAGLSRQLSEFATDVSLEFKTINERLQSLEDRLIQCESNGCSTEDLKKEETAAQS